MLRPTLASVALAAAFGTAQAGSLLETVEHAAEVGLPALEWPNAEGGTVRFAACDGCETRSFVISHGASYLVNGRPATFEAFAAAIRTARAASSIADHSLVGLYFDAASTRLVRIALVAPLPR
jgi:hypothetical protein